MKIKICGKCKEPKLVSEFRKYNRTGGYQSYCKPCENAYKVAWHKRNRTVANKKAKDWYYKNRDKVSAYGRKERYGLMNDTYELMLKKQENSCAICLLPFVKTPHVDHCHKTGKIRGLLCSSCNTGLGAFKDDVPTIQNALDYIVYNY